MALLLARGISISSPSGLKIREETIKSLQVSFMGCCLESFSLESLNCHMERCTDAAVVVGDVRAKAALR